MDRKSWVTLILILLGAGLGAHGVFTDTGPVGWLNALQQRMFGSYYRMMSFLLVAGGFAALGGALWDGFARFQGREPDGVLRQILLGPGKSPASAQTPAGQSSPSALGPDAAPALAQSSGAAPEAPTAQGKVFFWCAVVLSGLTWAVGGWLYTQKTKHVQEDASATYESVVLTDGTPLPALRGSHLALRGIPIHELQVVHHTEQGSSKHEDYRLQPVVGIGWKPEHPVSFILKLDSSHGLPAPDLRPDFTPRNPREVRLLVRREGAVPAPAVPEFKKMGVPLAAEATLIRTVATRDGKPILEDTSTDLFFMQIFCGGITFISVLMSLVLWLRRRYDLRKLAGGT